MGWYKGGEETFRIPCILAMMPDNLRLYHKIRKQMIKFLPDQHITRLRNMALLVMGLFLGRSVHHARIVSEWPVPGRNVSLVNRLRRLLKNSHVAVDTYFRPIARALISTFSEAPLYVLVDATKTGPSSQLMTAALAYRRRALPLVWTVRKGRRGISSARRQIQLLARLTPLVPAGQEVWIIGDSEFQHVKTLRFIEEQGWNYIIRQSGRLLAAPAGESYQKLQELAPPEGQARHMGAARLTETYGHRAYLATCWQEDHEDPWLLASNQPTSPKTFRLYGKRMWIDELYGDLKSHGFYLEDTRMRQPERLERLVLGVFWTYVWLISLGSYVVKRGWRPLVDRNDRRDKSYFRIGWDFLKRTLRLAEPLRLRFAPYP